MGGMGPCQGWMRGRGVIRRRGRESPRGARRLSRGGVRIRVLSLPGCLRRQSTSMRRSPWGSRSMCPTSGQRGAAPRMERLIKMTRMTPHRPEGTIHRRVPMGLLARSVWTTLRCEDPPTRPVLSASCTPRDVCCNTGFLGCLGSTNPSLGPATDSIIPECAAPQGHRERLLWKGQYPTSWATVRTPPHTTPHHTTPFTLRWTCLRGPCDCCSRAWVRQVMMVRYKKNDKIYALKSIRKAHVVKNKKVRDSLGPFNLCTLPLLVATVAKACLPACQSFRRPKAPSLTIFPRGLQVRHTQTERNIMQRINHPYVMKLHFSFQNSGKLYMVMDYLNGGDIFYHCEMQTQPRCRPVPPRLAAGSRSCHLGQCPLKS
jgi:hypothetical protein